MGNEGQDSPRDVAREEQKHPWELFPGDETSAEKGRKKRKENKKFNWVKTHKLLTAGIACAIVAVIAGGIVGIILLNKKGDEAKPIDESNKIGITYDEYLKLLSLDKSSPANAFDYATGTLKPILTEGIYNSSIGVDYTKLEDNFAVFLKKIENEDEKICYRLATIYTMYRLGDMAAERAGILVEQFDEEGHELNRTQKYFYMMVQVEKATASGNIDEAMNILNQIDEEYPYDEGYVETDTGEEITDPEEKKRIDESFNQNTEVK